MSPAVFILIVVLAVIASTVALIVRGVSGGKKAEAETARLRQHRHAEGPIAGLKIAPLAPVDRPAWERHWASYCDYYETQVPASTTEVTWSRLMDPASPMNGWGAYDGSGNLLGFAHTVLHPHTWSPKTLCYLEDLFVAQPFRGRDIGYALINFLWKKAEDEGWGRVYWHTETANAAARRLYDRFRPADPYVRYTLTIDAPSSDAGRGL
jgi:GNAT superfamily N-acetyltransferase